MTGLKFEFSHRGRSRRVTIHAPSVVLGRSPDCDLILDLPSIRPRHLIVQVDPPFVRAKLLESTAKASTNDGPLTTKWRQLRPGVSLKIPSTDQETLLVRISAAAPAQRTTVIAPSGAHAVSSSDFGVRFVMESALDGEHQGWLVRDSGEDRLQAPSPDVLPAPTGRNPLKKALVISTAVMVALMAAALAFNIHRRASRAALWKADCDAIWTALARSDEFLHAKDYVAAKAELERARALAARWPTLNDKVREIDWLMARPAIRLGANGYVLMESQWLPGETARAWSDARKRDDPKIDLLLTRATSEFAAEHWENCRLACNDALSLIDSHPVKSHPTRDAFHLLLTRAGNEILRAEMTAKGFVLYEDKWVTPQEQFKLQQLAKGLVEYKGNWMTSEQAFAAQQTDKGLVLFQGRWMTADESMTARGFVRFEGKWMSVTEKASTLATRAAEEERRRQAIALQSQRRAQQAAQREREQAKIEANKETAYRMSQDFLKDRLHSPSSAKFPEFSDSRVTVVYTDGWYVVGAVVDAQNTFGVMLRKRYICKLRPVVGTQKWEQETTGIIE